MSKILIPIDGSEYSQRAVEIGKGYATKFDREIVLLNVADTTLPDGSYRIPTRFDFKQFALEVQQQCEAILVEGKKALGEKAETVLLSGDPADKIIEYVDTNDVDLIIMGVHGQNPLSLFKRLFIGNVTDKVLRRVKQPVLVVK